LSSSIVRIVLILGLAGVISAPARSSVLPETTLPSVGADECHFPPSIFWQLAVEFDNRFPDFWDDTGHVASLYAQFEAMEQDGLNPARYKLTEPLEQDFGAANCRSRRLTLAFIQALHDLKFGRIDPQHSGFVWHVRPLTAAQQTDILAPIVMQANADLSRSFEYARSAAESYIRLRTAYGQLKSALPLSWPTVDDGELLRQGDFGLRVAQLIARLQASGLYQEQDAPAVIDSELTAALKAFQQTRGLAADGIVGPMTLRELNRTPASLLDQVNVNLERLRWSSFDLPDRYLYVDLVGAVARLYRSDSLEWSGRVQIGMPHRPSPSLVSDITHLTLNPTWTVPPTILRKDKLPEIRRDIGYLAKHRIRVLNHEGRELDPRQVNWYRPGRIMLRQDAGPDSALGLVAFRFPNPFSVYLHDTPNKGLFDRDSRLFSSGCVRVENAMSLARILVQNAGEDTATRFERILASGRTANLNLPESIPIIMVYVTAVVDPAGNIQFRQDDYKLDDRLRNLLEN
jgi:L,D-transpeptidase YcbB